MIIRDTYMGYPHNVYIGKSTRNGENSYILSYNASYHIYCKHSDSLTSSYSSFLNNTFIDTDISEDGKTSYMYVDDSIPFVTWDQSFPDCDWGIQVSYWSYICQEWKRMGEVVNVDKNRPASSSRLTVVDKKPYVIFWEYETVGGACDVYVRTYKCNQ